MSLTQNLNEFRFNLETADLLTSMGTPSNEVVSTLGTLGFNHTLASFMVGQRTLLNSVLLRLQIYNDRGVPEAQVRSGLAVLSNHGVNSLVDYLYNSGNATHTVPVVQQPDPVVAKQPVPIAPVKQTPAPVPEPEEEGEELEEDEEEESHFDTFFTARVRESDDPTHIVKMSEMYSAFTSWWSEQYEEDSPVPTKDELKEYLSERLGRQIKANVTNVSLA